MTTITPPVNATLSRLSEVSRRFDEFVSRQVDELSALEERLALREGELARQRQRWTEAQREQQRTERLLWEQSARREQLEVELASAKSELANHTDLLTRQARAQEEAAQSQVDELRRELGAVDGEMQSLREHLDRLTVELAAAKSESAGLPLLIRERDAAQSQLDRLRGELSEARQQLDEARCGLAEAHGGLSTTLGDISRTSEALAAARQELAAARDGRDRAEAGLTEARDGQARAEAGLAEARDGRARAEAGLAEARAELARDLASADEVRLEAARAFQDLAQVEQQLAQAEAEREELTSELELLLTRAAELAETMAQERREAAEQRSAWEAELAALRHAQGVHGAPPGERGQNVVQGRRVALGQGVTTTRSVARDPPRAGVPADPVLDSVVAQFATLKQTARS